MKKFLARKYENVVITFAFKILDGSHSDATSMMRFQKEAQVGSQLKHSNLVRVTDFGVVDDQIFLVMDLVDGPTLLETTFTTSTGVIT